MTTQSSAASSDFIKNLGRMYGTYTGGFVAFIVLLAILEQVGVPNQILGYLFVFFTLQLGSAILVPADDRRWLLVSISRFWRSGGSNRLDALPVIPLPPEANEAPAQRAITRSPV